MTIIAVITGDIVSSRLITDQRDLLLETLKETIQEISDQKHLSKLNKMDIFRGDSFQTIIDNAEKALLVSFLIRAKLRGMEAVDEIKSRLKYWDARIGIGIGSIDFIGRNVSESDGEAFRLSGKSLDGMKTDSRLKVLTPWPDLNKELEVSISLADVIIGKWSNLQAQACYKYLLHPVSQSALASELGISQPALSKRLKSAGIESLMLLLDRFQKVISESNELYTN